MQNSTLLSCDHTRDLGIEIDGKLRFDQHFHNITKAAYQRVAVIFRGFASKDPKILILAFKIFVRPALEYCSNVWSPFRLKDIDGIEQVQRYFTRRLAGCNGLSYPERLELFNLESLEIRRIKSDLIMYYKIIHKLIDIPVEIFF